MGLASNHFQLLISINTGYRTGAIREVENHRTRGLLAGNRTRMLNASFPRAAPVAAGGDLPFYLLEAKWQNERTVAADIHSFQGKIGQKAAWTRGVFISHAGFTEDGLTASGRAKNIISPTHLLANSHLTS
jgi:hypothetical protein